MKSLIKKSPIGSNRLMIIIEKDVASIYSIDFDSNQPLSFFSLLAETVDELKSEKVTRVIKQVSEDDWNEHLKGQTSWSILTSDRGTMTIICPVDDLLNNFARGLGIENPFV